MKFKYMLRGLGIGVIITACVMGGYTRNAVAKARVTVLKQYGLTEDVARVEDFPQTGESSSVADTAESVPAKNEDTEAENGSAAGQEETAAADVSGADSATESGSEADAGNGSEESKTVGTGETAEGASAPVQESVPGVPIVVEPSDGSVVVEPGDVMEIVISQGDDSAVVSRKLYNAGIVESAAEFDAFLMQHGYDKKINPGTKSILATDTWQEIAEKLTKK